jgi:FeoB-associated Cys-rich membrane protein
MVQSILVIALFAAALFYVGRLIYKNFTAKSGCASGCGKCAIDFSQIENQLKKKNA